MRHTQRHWLARVLQIFNKRNDIITICLRFALKMNKSAIKLLPFIKTNVTMKECLKKYFKISSVYYFITSNEWYVLQKRKKGGIGAYFIFVMIFFKDTNEKKTEINLEICQDLFISSFFAHIIPVWFPFKWIVLKVNRRLEQKLINGA